MMMTTTAALSVALAAAFAPYDSGFSDSGFSDSGFSDSGFSDSGPHTSVEAHNEGGSAPIPSVSAIPASPFGAPDYGNALNLSMQFYYAQYSGELPEDYPISWRGDSGLSDGADVGVDLTGGWYDAGDHVKFGFSISGAVTMLAWGGLDFKAGYEASGAYDDLIKHLVWINDYFLRTYDDKGTPETEDDVLYGQVGDGDLDHDYWGTPEAMSMERPTGVITADVPGTEIAAETAAAMAASALVLRDAGETALSEKLIAKAQRLFAFGEAHQGTYTDAIPDADKFYHSWSGYTDELSWAAAWLYKATGERRYLEKSERYYAPTGLTYAHFWDNKANGAAILLYELTGKATYRTDIDTHLEFWMNELPRVAPTPTNKGLAWLDKWGSNRYAGNTSLLAMQMARVLGARGDEADTGRIAQLIAFSTDQIDALLGDNANGQSYVVGFGEKYPKQPHHRAASGTTDQNSPHDNKYDILGALVGGPDDQGHYTDKRNDYVANEVACDYNAGFSGALAALAAPQSTAKERRQKAIRPLNASTEAKKPR